MMGYVRWLDSKVDPARGSLRGLAIAHFIGCAWSAAIILTAALFLGEPGTFLYQNLFLPTLVASLIPLLLHYARFLHLFAQTDRTSDD